MSKKTAAPMPKVEFDGCVYSLTSRKTPILDLSAMNELEAILWLNRNTRARGYSKPTPNIAFGEAIKIL